MSEIVTAASRDPSGFRASAIRVEGALKWMLLIWAVMLRLLYIARFLKCFTCSLHILVALHPKFKLFIINVTEDDREAAWVPPPALRTARYARK